MDFDAFLGEVKLEWDPSYKYWRIKDRYGHFLGKISDNKIFFYCKRDKGFYVLTLNIQEFLKKEVI